MSIVRKPNVDLLKSLILQNSNNKNKTNNKNNFIPHSFRREKSSGIKHSSLWCSFISFVMLQR